jgi:hypothetical protein
MFSHTKKVKLGVKKIDNFMLISTMQLDHRDETLTQKYKRKNGFKVKILQTFCPYTFLGAFLSPRLV